MKRIFFLVGLPALGALALILWTAAAWVPDWHLDGRLPALGWVVWFALAGPLWFWGLLFPVWTWATTVLPGLEKAWSSTDESLEKLAWGHFEAVKAQDPVFIPRPAAGPARDLGRGLERAVDVTRRVTTHLNRITAQPLSRLVFVGVDASAQGRRAAQIVGSLVTRGPVAGLVGHRWSACHMDRWAGFAHALAADHPELRPVLAGETEEQPDTARTVTGELLAAWPDLAAIYLTEGATVPVVAEVLAASGRSGIVLVVHDFAEETLRLIGTGQVAASLAEEAFPQGWDAVIHTYNALCEVWTPEVDQILQDPLVLTKENLSAHWSPGRGFQTPESHRSGRPQPLVENPSRPLKIAVLGAESSSSWFEVRAGVLAASAHLGSRAVRIDWLPTRRTLALADLEDLLRRIEEVRYDAVVAPVEDPALAEPLNRLAVLGFLILTYRCEPGGIRPFLAQTARQADRLHRAEARLTTQSRELGAVAADLRRAVETIGDQSDIQSQRSRAVRHQARSLGTSLGHLFAETRSALEEGRFAARRLEQNLGPLETTLQTLAGFEVAFASIGSQRQQLAEGAHRISLVVGKIETVVSRVNLLAFNAAIEASRAGASGYGFKVIADEVRTLSEGIKDSVAEIRQGTDEWTAALEGLRLTIDQSHSQLRLSESRGQLSLGLVHGLQTYLEAEAARNQAVGSHLDPVSTALEEATRSLSDLDRHEEDLRAALDQVKALQGNLVGQVERTLGLVGTLEALAGAQEASLRRFQD